MNWTSISKFFNSSEGKQVLAFIAGKNSKQLGAWLVKLGKLIGSEGIASKAVIAYAGKAGLKVGGLAAASYIAYEDCRKAYSRVKNTWNRDDLNIMEKAAKTCWETWPPVMAAIDIKDFCTWLFKKKKKSDEGASGRGLNPSTKSISVNPSAKEILDNLNRQARTDVQGKAAREAANEEMLNYQDKASSYTGLSKKAIANMPTSELERALNAQRRDNMNNKRQTNDPKWYMKGQAEKLVAGTLTWTDIKTNHKSFPIVAATAFHIELVLPLVDSKLPMKVVNNFEALFGALRGPNTGAYNYAATDVFDYILYLYSFIIRVKYLHKIIKAAHTHNVMNDNLARILTDSVLATPGTYDDIIQNGPSLISRINAIAEDINTWPLINTSWLDRWSYLCDKNIKDYNGSKAVYGVYRLMGMPSLDSSSGTIARKSLFAVTISNTLAILEADYAKFKALTGSLNVANCMLKIAGDFCKLLGTDSGTFNNVPYLDQLTPGKLFFDYDQEANFQMQNAKIFGQILATPTYPSFDGSVPGSYVGQATVTTSAGTLTGNNPYASTQPWMVVNDQEKCIRTTANNIEMTQFVWNGTVVWNDGTGKYAHTITDCSVALLAYFHIFYYTPGGTGAAITAGKIGPYMAFSVNASYEWGTPYTLQLAMRQIDFLPSPVLIHGTSSTMNVDGRYIDVDNYAEITSDQIRNYVLVSSYSLSYTYSMEDVELKKKVKA